MKTIHHTYFYLFIRLISSSVILYLLVPSILAVILAVTDPLSLQALVAVWTAQLRRAARWSHAVHLVRVVTAVGVSVTSQTFRHTLATSAAILESSTGF